MKNIITLTLLALATFCAAQTNQVKTPGVSYSAGAPNWVPVVKTASELAIDTVAKRMYLWNRNTGAWDLQGQGIDNTSGGTPPAYTPGQTDSKFAINNASPPELYAWTGSAWAKVGGTIQTIDTFLVSGSVVSLSLSQDNQPAKTITLPASGITALTGDVTASGPGSAAATIAAGAVTASKINQMGASSGQVLKWLGSAWGPGNDTGGWELTGNAATAGSSFLGTTNLVSLAFRTNNVQRMKIDSLGRIGIGTNTPFSPLHVSGSVNQLSLRIQRSLADLEYNGIGFGSFISGADAPLKTGIAFQRTATFGRGSLHFLQNSAADTSSANLSNAAMTISNAGNVGIGTVSPSNLLHLVRNGGSNTAIRFESSSTGGPTLILNSTNISAANRYPGVIFENNAVAEWALQTRTGNGKLVLFDVVSNFTRFKATTTGIYLAGAMADGNEANSVLTALHTGFVGIGTATPGHRLVIHGTGNTSSTFGLQVHNLTGNNNGFVVRNDGWVGFGKSTSAQADKIDIQGTSTSDGAILDVELATTGSGTNWTGTGFATGYVHTTGDVTPLTATGLTILASALYYVEYTITGRTAGSVVVSYGGISTASVTVSGIAPQSLTASTATLVVTPTTDFDGTIVVSVKRRLSSSAIVAFVSSAGTLVNQIRNSGAISNVFFGLNAGAYNISAAEKTFVGYNSGLFSTSGSQTTGYGARAGENNTIGINWTSVGARSGRFNTIGSNWTAVGASAATNNTLYGSFVAIGSGAAPQTHFQNGVYVGTSVVATEGVTGTPTTNEVVIGHAAVGKGSNTVQLGTAGTTTQSYIAGQIIGGSIAVNANTDILTLFNATNAYGSIYGNNNVGFRLYNGNTNPNNSFQFFTSKGTTSAPVLVAASDNLGSLLFNGHDGASYRPAGSINCFAEGTPATGTVPTSLRFSTTAQGIGAYSEKMRITPSGGVLVGTTTEDLSAVLNLNSTAKGFLPPRLTSTQASAIASPAEGLMVYVTNTNATFPTKGWYGWNGATWEKLNN